MHQQNRKNVAHETRRNTHTHVHTHRYLQYAVEVDTERPVLVDKYLDKAVEMDVDALCDR